MPLLACWTYPEDSAGEEDPSGTVCSPYIIVEPDFREDLTPVYPNILFPQEVKVNPRSTVLYMILVSSNDLVEGICDRSLDTTVLSST